MHHLPAPEPCECLHISPHSPAPLATPHMPSCTHTDGHLSTPTGKSPPMWSYTPLTPTHPILSLKTAHCPPTCVSPPSSSYTDPHAQTPVRRGQTGFWGTCPILTLEYGVASPTMPFYPHWALLGLLVRPRPPCLVTAPRPWGTCHLLTASTPAFGHCTWCCTCVHLRGNSYRLLKSRHLFL
jgi:hypothetical protein